MRARVVTGSSLLIKMAVHVRLLQCIRLLLSVLLLLLCAVMCVQSGHAAAMSVFCNPELSKADRAKSEASHLCLLQ
jgi:hypothetical protein